MDHLHIKPVIDQLMKQLLSPILALDKHQQRRRETLEGKREREGGEGGGGERREKGRETTKM